MILRIMNQGVDRTPDPGPLHGRLPAFQPFSWEEFHGMESGKRAARAVLEGATPADRVLIPGLK